MRYTYGIAIRTFNGSKRVACLLRSMQAINLKRFADLVIVEDNHPGENHEQLVAIAKEYGVRLVTCETWVNMQGTANRALQECKADFVFLLSDDVLVTGDPFRNVIRWLENCPQDIAEITGGLALTQYNAIPDLVREGIFPDKVNHAHIQQLFYSFPFETWFKHFLPIQYNSNMVLPSMGRNVHGAAYCLSRKAWEEVGGYDLRWHADDQQISYKIWLKTPKIIYILPCDPFIHCGACAGAEGFHYNDAIKHGAIERCREVFGIEYKDIELAVTYKIQERAPIWQERIVREYNKIGFPWRFV